MKIVTSQASRSFQGPAGILFDAIIAAPTIAARDARPGDILEVSTLSGTPHQVGHVAAVRVHWGLLDLHLTETITAHERPSHISISRLPMGASPYDPAERLPPPGTEFFPNPERTFQRAFGTDPVPQILHFALQQRGAETALEISWDVSKRRRLTAWGNRRDARHLASELEAMLDAIFVRATVRLG